MVEFILTNRISILGSMFAAGMLAGIVAGLYSRFAYKKAEEVTSDSFFDVTDMLHNVVMVQRALIIYVTLTYISIKLLIDWNSFSFVDIFYMLSVCTLTYVNGKRGVEVVSIEEAAMYNSEILELQLFIEKIELERANIEAEVLYLREEMRKEREARSSD